jgi:hypothetical protein
MKLNSEGVQRIAKVCHEANRGLCAAFGDHSQTSWEDAPEWQRESAVSGVTHILSDPDAPPSASHDNWLAEKQRDGWVYGPVKNSETKEHPCMVPYEDLPQFQQAKDHVFKAVVLAAAGALNATTPNIFSAAYERAEQ